MNQKFLENLKSEA